MTGPTLKRAESDFWTDLRFAAWPNPRRFLDTEEKRARFRQQRVAYYAYTAVLLIPGIVLASIGLLASSYGATILIELLVVPLFVLPGLYALVLTLRISSALRRF